MRFGQLFERSVCVNLLSLHDFSYPQQNAQVAISRMWVFHRRHFTLNALKQRRKEQ
eukprot:c39831_g1_i1 orf=63-230(-)